VNIPTQAKTGLEWATGLLHVPPCLEYCFKGDSRSFTISISPTVTSKINGIITFVLPGMAIIDAYAYSNTSYDKFGDTATAIPNINAVTIGTDTLEIGETGANPLIFPQSLSPNIKTNLNLMYEDSTPGQVCYSGSMYGNQFPDSEAFVVNSKSQATKLITFATPGSPNAGPIQYLPQDGTSNMGSFSNICVAK
jgi:hypothetical protein